MIIFFIRRYNDIDHIVPIIYKTLLTRDYRICVLCLNNDIDIVDDFRLRFLKKEFDINVQFAGQYFWPDKAIQKFISYFSYGLFYKNGNIDNNSYAKYTIKNTLLSENVKLLIFDWQRYNNIFLSSTILAVANELGIPKCNCLALHTTDPDRLLPEDLRIWNS